MEKKMLYVSSLIMTLLLPASAFCIPLHPARSPASGRQSSYPPPASTYTTISACNHLNQLKVESGIQLAKANTAMQAASATSKRAQLKQATAIQNAVNNARQKRANVTTAKNTAIKSTQTAINNAHEALRAATYTYNNANRQYRALTQRYEDFHCS
jgi:hypothetical protein